MHIHIIRISYTNNIHIIYIEYHTILIFISYNIIYNMYIISNIAPPYKQSTGGLPLAHYTCIMGIMMCILNAYHMYIICILCVYMRILYILYVYYMYIVCMSYIMCILCVLPRAHIKSFVCYMYIICILYTI